MILVKDGSIFNIVPPIKVLRLGDSFFCPDCTEKQGVDKQN